MDGIWVLVVDDEEDFLDPMVERLRTRGLHVLSATSGKEALDILGMSPVEVVVLDVKMPGMDGIETLREIKSRHSGVEVILLTGHADLENSILGMDQGAFDYLLKPADIDTLVLKIQDACRKNEAGVER